MATVEERLDAAIDKYEELYAKLMNVADYLHRMEDCPYFSSNSMEKRAMAMKGLGCPFECQGDLRDQGECWRKWVLMAPADWWTV